MASRRKKCHVVGEGDSRNVLVKKEDAGRVSLLLGKRETVHMNARESALRGPPLSVKL